MMTHRGFSDEAWYHLTRHFFLGLFHFGGVLSTGAADSFRGVLVGIGAAIVSFGLLMTRMYLGKYAALSALFTSRDGYLLAVVADETLIVALPMIVVAVVTLLVSASIFPDEVDLRVLLPLPISKRSVCGSKACAVVLFAGVFVLATHIAMTPVLVLMSNSRWSAQGVVRHLGAFWLAGLFASTFTVTAIMAIQGAMLCVLGVQRQVVSVAVRSIMLCALGLSVPLVLELPVIGPLVASESPLLYFVPPAWFLGIERLLLGDATPYFVRLAGIATTMALAAVLVAAGSYTFLYRHLDRILLRPAGLLGRPVRFRYWRSGDLFARLPGCAAISPFIRATLTRSPLHQGVFVGIAACSAAVVVNAFIGDSTIMRSRPADPSRIDTATWAPFVLVFGMTLACRAVLVLPIEIRANWILRLLDNENIRGEQVSAMVGSMALLGVLLPLVLILPLEWLLLGSLAIRSMLVAFVCGLLLVELHMGEWRRMAFSCSYAPGRRFVGITVLLTAAAFVFFTAIGARLSAYSLTHTRGWLMIVATLGAAVFYLRRQRLVHARKAALIFDDVLPSDVEPLQLSMY